jgi:hypothetical protein
LDGEPAKKSCAAVRIRKGADPCASDAAGRGNAFILSRETALMPAASPEDCVTAIACIGGNPVETAGRLPPARQYLPGTCRCQPAPMLQSQIKNVSRPRIYFEQSEEDPRAG